MSNVVNTIDHVEFRWNSIHRFCQPNLITLIFITPFGDLKFRRVYHRIVDTWVKMNTCNPYSCRNRGSKTPSWLRPTSILQVFTTCAEWSRRWEYCNSFWWLFQYILDMLLEENVHTEVRAERELARVLGSIFPANLLRQAQAMSPPQTVLQSGISSLTRLAELGIVTVIW